jgi:hypothetical protein
VFPFPKNTNITRLKQVGLVRGELNDSYLIIYSF